MQFQVVGSGPLKRNGGMHGIKLSQFTTISQQDRHTDSTIDVTMGSYNGAETCELIGTYMLSLITANFKDQVGLKITIEANKKTVHFLDLTFDLTSGTYKPFMKPNNKLLYVHRRSNHPPALLKNIPENITKRLTSISSNKEVFDEAIPPYQKALDENGYTYKLTH